jgi:hypothetical protein
MCKAKGCSYLDVTFTWYWFSFMIIAFSLLITTTILDGLWWDFRGRFFLTWVILNAVTAVVVVIVPAYIHRVMK